MADLHRGDCLDIMAGMDSGSIDLTVTSPPYDNLRTYNGSLDDWNEAKWQAIIAELYRLTADGGVVVWVVGDATVKGSETATSFKQALAAISVGFNLHDTMIYQKAGTGACGSNYCYRQTFEYMFVWSKGKPKAINRLRDHKNTSAGASQTQGRISVAGEIKDNTRRVVPEFSVRENIWRYNTNKFGMGPEKHPAKFPEALARDHILSWSNPGDMVFDPFLGSGTTGKMALVNGRLFTGIERDTGYFAMAKQRCQPANDNDLFAAAAQSEPRRILRTPHLTVGRFSLAFQHPAHLPAQTVGTLSARVHFRRSSLASRVYGHNCLKFHLPRQFDERTG